MKRFIYLLLIPALLICLQPTPGFSEEATDASSKAEKVEAPTEFLVTDFEKGDEDRTNNLGGESGGWNLDPMDINDSWCDDDIIEVAGPDGTLNKALRLHYSVESAKPSQNGWWTKLQKFDASGYDHLRLDVKGDVEKGFTSKFKIQLKKFKPPREGEEESYVEEKIKSSYEIPVTDQWQTIEIPLNRMTGLIDFANPEAWQNPAIARKDLDEFVVVFQDRHVSKKTGRLFLDNIRFVNKNEPGPTAVDFPPQTREKTETKLEGLDFARYLISRLGGFPSKTVVKKEFPEDQREFFMEIAKDTWKFFDNIVDQEHGLVLDTVQMATEGDEPIADGVWIGDYTNVTNIGVYFMVVTAAYDFGFITREEAVKRLRLTMDTLEKIEYHSSGFPFNYYDTTLASRTSYFVSLVDSGWLVAGLYVAKNAFPEELKEQAERLIGRGDLEFFYDPVERQMFHGYYEHLEVYSDYHYGVFYTEPRASSYISIAAGQVPEEHWYAGLIRTFTEKYDWQAQMPKNRVAIQNRGHTYYGGHYEWNGIKYIPSWGGSSFEALMPTLILKERELAPEGLGLNNARHVEISIKYTKEFLGYPVWGMSPSAIAEGGYSEYGVAPLGAKGYKPGVVTPHASIIAIEYAPDEVEANLRELIKRYDIYGEYGFYDAVRIGTAGDAKHKKSVQDALAEEGLKEGTVARRYLSLDQGMIFVALSNYLKNGAIRNYFHADPKMKQGEFLLTSEKFFQEDSSSDAEAVA